MIDENQYKYKLQPYPFQEVGFKRTCRLKTDATLMDLGLGKTKLTLDTASFMWMNSWIDALLVFGNCGSYSNWVEACAEHIPDEVTWVCGIWSSKKTKKQKEVLRTLLYKTYEKRTLIIFIVNIEAMSHKSGIELVNVFLDHFPKKVMSVVDESTTIGNPTSARTKAMFKVRDKSIVRRILTGSMVDNSPFNCYSQFEFLKSSCLGFSSFVSFKNFYSKGTGKVIMDRTAMQLLVAKFEEDRKKGLPLRYVPSMIGGMQEIETVKKAIGDDAWNYLRSRHRNLRCFNTQIEYQNLDDLQKRIAKVAYIIKKEGNIDLPPQLPDVLRYVDMTPEQEKVYNELKENCIAQLSETEVVSVRVAITKLLRLHQIACGHTKSDEGVITRIPNNRVTSLLDVLEETTGRVIIWNTFVDNIREIYDAIAEKYGTESVMHYYGETKEEDRELVKKYFKRGTEKDGLRFLVANASTGGYGNNFTAATYSIYFGYDFDNNIHHQTRDRTYRIGQTEPTSYVYLACPDTVDIKILNALRTKTDISNYLTQENWKEFFK
jgi:hypothetical protein